MDSKQPIKIYKPFTNSRMHQRSKLLTTYKDTAPKKKKTETPSNFQITDTDIIDDDSHNTPLTKTTPLRSKMVASDNYLSFAKTSTSDSHKNLGYSELSKKAKFKAVSPRVETTPTKKQPKIVGSQIVTKLKLQTVQRVRDTQSKTTRNLQFSSSRKSFANATEKAAKMGIKQRLFSPQVMVRNSSQQAKLFEKTSVQPVKRIVFKPVIKAQPQKIITKSQTQSSLKVVKPRTGTLQTLRTGIKCPSRQTLAPSCTKKSSPGYSRKPSPCQLKPQVPSHVVRPKSKAVISQKIKEPSVKIPQKQTDNQLNPVAEYSDLILGGFQNLDFTQSSFKLRKVRNDRVTQQKRKEYRMLAQALDYQQENENICEQQRLDKMEAYIQKQKLKQQLNTQIKNNTNSITLKIESEHSLTTMYKDMDAGSKFDNMSKRQSGVQQSFMTEMNSYDSLLANEIISPKKGFVNMNLQHSLSEIMDQSTLNFQKAQRFAVISMDKIAKNHGREHKVFAKIFQCKSIGQIQEKIKMNYSDKFYLIILRGKLFETNCLGSEELLFTYYRLIGFAYNNKFFEKFCIPGMIGHHYTFVIEGVPQTIPFTEENRELYPFSKHSFVGKECKLFSIQTEILDQNKSGDPEWQKESILASGYFIVKECAQYLGVYSPNIEDYGVKMIEEKSPKSNDTSVSRISFESIEREFVDSEQEK